MRVNVEIIPKRRNLICASSNPNDFFSLLTSLINVRSEKPIKFNMKTAMAGPGAVRILLLSKMAAVTMVGDIARSMLGRYVNSARTRLEIAVKMLMANSITSFSIEDYFPDEYLAKADCKRLRALWRQFLGIRVEENGPSPT